MNIDMADGNSLPDLPCEIQLMIYEYLAAETATLASLARTCTRTKDAANKILYDNIIVINYDLKLLRTGINLKASKRNDCFENVKIMLTEFVSRLNER